MRCAPQLFLLPLLHAAAAVAAAAPSKPHLLMLVVDDLGWSDVGFHGSDFPTPNVDGMASSGVSLEKYYVQQVCSPTRSALMTSKYPFRTGLQHITTLLPGSRAAIPKETPTLAEILKDVGYATHAIGKWHLGFASWSDTPLGRGFDSYAGYLNGAIDYYTHTINKGYDLWRNKSAAFDQNGLYTTPFYLAEAQRVIEQHDLDTPMFMYYASQLMHQPLQDPDDGGKGDKACAKVCSTSSPIGEYASQGRCTLCKMAVNMDDEVGTLISLLKTRGMWNNTLVWLTTDNGGMTTGIRADNNATVWSASSNFPLRGGKTTLFEGGVRGVSIVSGGYLPSKAQGTARDALAMHVDIPSTMAALAGAQWGDLGSDGFNIWETITAGSPSPRIEVPVNIDTCVGSAGGPPCGKNRSFNALIVTSSTGAQQWKLIDTTGMTNLNMCPNSSWCTGAGLYDGWWSNDPYDRMAPNGSTEGPVLDGGNVNSTMWLFDLMQDPNERHNIANENPEVVATLRARLAELADPKNGYRDPQANVVSPRSLPIFHNGTWAPFLKGATATAMTSIDEQNTRVVESTWADALMY